MKEYKTYYKLKPLDRILEENKGKYEIERDGWIYFNNDSCITSYMKKFFGKEILLRKINNYPYNFIDKNEEYCYSKDWIEGEVFVLFTKEEMDNLFSLDGI